MKANYLFVSELNEADFYAFHQDRILNQRDAAIRKLTRTYSIQLLLLILVLTVLFGFLQFYLLSLILGLLLLILAGLIIGKKTAPLIWMLLNRSIHKTLKKQMKTRQALGSKTAFTITLAQHLFRVDQDDAVFQIEWSHVQLLIFQPERLFLYTDTETNWIISTQALDTEVRKDLYQDLAGFAHEQSIPVVHSLNGKSQS